MLILGSLLAASIALIMLFFGNPKKPVQKARDFRDRYKTQPAGAVPGGVERRARDAGAPGGVERRGQGFGKR